MHRYSTLQLHKYFLSRESKCVELFPLPLTHEQADKTGHYHPPIKMINWRKRSLSSRALFPFPPTYVCLSVCLRLHAQLFIPNATEEKETQESELRIIFPCIYSQFEEGRKVETCSQYHVLIFESNKPYAFTGTYYVYISLLLFANGFL